MWIKIVLNTFMVKNDNICQYMKLSGDLTSTAAIYVQI